jgi:signal transduction histidine kinase
MPQQRTSWDEPRLKDPIPEETPRVQRQLAKTPPFRIADERIQRRLQDTGWLWGTLRGIPGVRNWRVLSDSVFCLTSFPIGLVFFLVAVIGGVLGLTLSFVGVGLGILAWTFALMLWGAQVERSRLRAFLSINVGEAQHWAATDGNVISRIWQIIRSPQVWRDFLYMGLLFPIGILELALVTFPLKFIWAPIFYFIFGAEPGVIWGLQVTNPIIAITVLIMGIVIAVPTALLINLTAKLHGQLGLLLLGTSHEEVLTGRVEELTESRSAVMRAMHMERKRIERDLHDGAQQQLVALAMDLGRAREKMESDPEAARIILDDSHERAKRVMVDMRELVRGIHPAVLTDRGLDAAVSAVAGRAPIPVDVSVRVRDRLPEEVESTAYFVVVEALTNATKHAQASRARVSIQRDGNWLRITVTDNGRGGADPEQGTGMRGLRDRILALEGTFAFTSPSGKGTRITVEIPCEPSLPKIPWSLERD